MSPTNTKFGKSVIKISGLITALSIIIGTIGWVYNEYQDHKETRELELDSRIDARLEDHGNKILMEIRESIIIFHNEVDSLQSQIDLLIDKNKSFATGFRSDGENLYYRDMYRNDHKVFWDQTYNQYYYVNENGRAVYL